MSGNNLTLDELNASRKLAVRLRLLGEKLSTISVSTGLSAPTVISAVKAYRAGGWPAVEVRPRRGRPAKNQESTSQSETAALVEAILAGPPVTGADRLWTRSAVAAWLDNRLGRRHSAGSVARLCASLGLDFDAQTLPDPVRRNTLIYQTAVEVRTGWPQLDGSVQQVGLLCTRGSRGQMRWRAFEGMLNAGHYIDFLESLLVAGHQLELAIHGAKRLMRVPELAQWIDFQAGGVRLVEPRRSKRRVTSGAPASSGRGEQSKGPGGPLTHLQRLEAESIHIMREVVAEAKNPVMLYSVGKDSAVMLHLAMKAFYPAKPPFPLLHVDTRWKFREMYAFRDRLVKELGLDLITFVNPDGVAQDINPFTHGSAIHTDIMKTEGLKLALDKYGFDAAFGGARRDEEKSRAKERIFSFRSASHRWDPKNQRPEVWKLYNARKHAGESLRVFPLSNWTELDIWQYIHLQQIPIVPLYFAAERPVVERHGTLIMVDDDRMPLAAGEVPMLRKVRFRTLGCYPLTGAIESSADTLPAIIQEMLLTRTSERQGRVIDHDSAASMEKKKQEGYF